MASDRVKRGTFVAPEGLAVYGSGFILVLMSEQINHSPEASSVAAFDGTYREVMSLLEQARRDLATADRDAAAATNRQRTAQQLVAKIS